MAQAEWHGRRLAQSDRFELVEGSGHVVYLERPDEFFGLLRRFIAARSLDF